MTVAMRYKRPVTKVLTHDLVCELVSYCPQTGHFVWAKDRRGANIKTGFPAGTLRRDGYITISILGKNYAASRLAWFIYHKEWPTNHIDHKNGIKDDNRIENLRCATVSQNGINKTLLKENTSGAKGVSKCKKSFRYKAQIKIDGVQISIGSFKELDEAAHAYNKAAMHHYGEFAVLNPIGVAKAWETAPCKRCNGSGETGTFGIYDCSEFGCDAAEVRTSMMLKLMNMEATNGSMHNHDLLWEAYKLGAAQEIERINQQEKVA